MATILLVEDAYDLAQVMKQELESCGYQVVHVSDGVTALRFHDRERPSLVVLDWMLPAMDGLEVLRRLRQTSPTPVLMLTARREEMDRVLGLELGADDYLTKPFGMREFLARVQALLRRAEHTRHVLVSDQQRPEKPLVYAGLLLDPKSHQATLDRRPLHLRPIEFAFLSLLLRSPGRTFSRAYLLDTLWEQGYDGSERSVDNMVLRLRKKLGVLGASIEAVWSIGYRLRPEERNT